MHNCKMHYLIIYQNSHFCPLHFNQFPYLSLLFLTFPYLSMSDEGTLRLIGLLSQPKNQKGVQGAPMYYEAKGRPGKVTERSIRFDHRMRTQA